TLAINPALWVYYLDIFRDFPVNLYLTPTIASWVGNYFSLQGVLRFIPFLLAFVSVGVWSVRSVKQSEVISTESEITAVSRLLVFSLICAPYLWVYDFVVALPALFLALYQSKSRSQLVFTSVTLTLGHLVLFTVASPMHFSVWYPFLLASLLFKPHRNAIQPKVTSNNVFVR
ncbi:MAG: hypothetical protein KDD62_08215, partial [Bdellovibrionales bacterium]|nr:hypothetical protein [Bdellovibrionales bacterium]